MLKLPSRAFAGHIFDCDGTIADTMPLHFLAWQAALGKHAADFPEELFYQWGGTKTNRIVELLNEEHGREMDVEEIVHQKETWFLEHMGEVRPIQPVVDLIRELAAGNAPIAVASGGFRHVILRILGALDLHEIFPVIVAAEDVEHGKPHPEPFLRAAELLGVPAGDCLVFEDSPTGIAAAKAAGMEWVEITRGMF